MDLPYTDGHLIDAELLNGLTDAQKRAFLSDCQIREFPSPKDILLQGETTDLFYLVDRGQVEVTYIDNHGNSIIVHLAGPGEILGEIEALSHRPCAATCRALANSSLLVCNTAAVLKHVPPQQLIINLAGLLHDRLARDNRQRSVDNYLTADQRIDHYLHQFSSELQPELFISQAYLATLAGCTRQTVNRRIGNLRQQGIVEISRGRIRVLKRDALQGNP
ncbi:Crp/Fnr family transcriptional regulator [Paracoccus aestuariivivens]|uniref:Cyclic nucleotide-binding domain-containing protein n=1 Tax=Paracoccus aestuariivivens TaxID=1820333 RepID=A0A6L6JD40_9RHOB|nr:Crp/Fnr family transcriptional regulator [Paracoccus aestuariivivens]MTH78074.1 cyclic nucleotide-binding domain-containing protein [Paracoccus aestuariivivens]